MLQFFFFFLNVILITEGDHVRELSGMTRIKDKNSEARNYFP